MTAVLREANDTDRATNLLLAVCDLYQTLVPLLVTPLGLRGLQQTVLDLATKEASTE